MGIRPVWILLHMLIPLKSISNAPERGRGVEELKKRGGTARRPAMGDENAMKRGEGNGRIEKRS